MTRAFIEGAVLAVTDAAFDYGRPNISMLNQLLTDTTTGVSFNMSRPGNLPLVDALTWQVTINGNITGNLTVLLEGTNDGSNWFTIDTYGPSQTSSLRSVSSHSGTGLPTHVLALRARPTVAGTGTGNFSVIIAA